MDTPQLSQKEVYRGHHNGLEIPPVAPVHQVQYAQYYYPQVVPEPEPKILGFRRATFILSAVVVFVILAAAIGGGVGGGLAVKEAETKCIS